MINFESTVSSLCDSCIYKHNYESHHLMNSSQNEVAEFVMAQREHMPDYLKLPIFILTAVFDLWSIITRGKRFHHLSLALRIKQITSWKMSPLKICRELMRFYESLIIFGYYASQEK